MKAVYIEWWDAASTGVSGWVDRATLDSFGLAGIRSLGWIYKETKTELVIVSHIDAGKLTSAEGELCIPKKWIIKRVNLRGIAPMEL